MAMYSSRLCFAIQRSLLRMPSCWYSGTSSGRGLRGARDDTVPLTQRKSGPEAIISPDLTLTVHLPDPSTGGTRSEPVYLDTVKMLMKHGPMLYFPFADPQLNLCTLWNFISMSYLTLTNKVTPTALVNLQQDVMGTWYNILLSGTPLPQSITTKDDPTGINRFEMYAAIGGETLYFVPISFVQGQAQNHSKQIVAASKISLQDKDNTFVWSQEEH